MSRSIHAAQGESLPYNHHLHQFLTFLKHERGFADATIVNRERSSETLFRLAGRRRRATVHSVAGGDYQVLHRYRGGPVEADHRLVPCTVSALVFSLCQQSRLVRGGHRRVHRRTPGLPVRKSAARADVGRREEAFQQRQRHVASSDQKSVRDPTLLGLRPARWRSLLPAS